MVEGRLLMTPEEVISRCDEDTIGVVPTLGVTFTGRYEPVQAVATTLGRYQEDMAVDIPSIRVTAVTLTRVRPSA